MLTTEEEAKALRCHRRLADKCIGSQCMAFRWHDEESEGNPGQTYRYERDASRGSPMRECGSQHLMARRGYCGLAGKPTA